MARTATAHTRKNAPLVRSRRLARGIGRFIAAALQERQAGQRTLSFTTRGPRAQDLSFVQKLSWPATAGSANPSYPTYLPYPSYPAFSEACLQAECGSAAARRAAPPPAGAAGA